MKKYLKAIAIVGAVLVSLSTSAIAKEQDDDYTVSEAYIPSGTAKALNPMYRALSATTDYQELE